MWSLFEHWLNKKKHAVAIPTHENIGVNFETDSLRFLYETHLKEYEVMWEEIRLRLQLEENTINYLFILIGGLLSASQVFSTQSSEIIASLNNNPSVYLIFAIISLTFPMTILQHNLYIMTLGSYLHFVLTPKIDMIASRLSLKSNAVLELLEWENKHFPTWLVGTLKWDDYRPRAQYRFALPVFAIMAIFRFMFVSVPSLVFIAAFLSAKAMVFWHNWTFLERTLAIILAIFVMNIFVGVIFGSGSYGFSAITDKDK